MTEKEVCLMCENYSEDTKCDQHDSCKLMAVLKENRALKKKVSQLKRQLDESELKRSYMVNPSAIGYRNDMENRELKEYLAEFADGTQVSIIIANPKKEKCIFRKKFL